MKDKIEEVEIITCYKCNKVKNENGRINQLDGKIVKITITHGLCTLCFENEKMQLGLE